jgi:hypothetical protein
MMTRGLIVLSSIVLLASLVGALPVEPSNQQGVLFDTDSVLKKAIQTGGSSNKGVVLTEQDFMPLFKRPFHPEINIDDKEKLDSLLETPSFVAFRELRISNFDMNLEEYDAQHEQARTELLDMAEKLEVPVNVDSDTYDEVLAKVEQAQSVHSLAQTEEGTNADAEDSEAQDEATHTFSLIESKLSQARSAAYLFANRASLRTAAADDGVTSEIRSVLDSSLAALVTHFQENACRYCRKMKDDLIPRTLNATSLGETYNNTELCHNGTKLLCDNIVQENVPGFASLAPVLCTYPLRFEFQMREWCRGGSGSLANRNISTECFCNSYVPKITIPTMRIFDIPIQSRPVLTDVPCAAEKIARCPPPL